MATVNNEIKSEQGGKRNFDMRSGKKSQKYCPFTKLRELRENCPQVKIRAKRNIDTTKEDKKLRRKKSVLFSIFFFGTEFLYVFITKATTCWRHTCYSTVYAISFSFFNFFCSSNSSLTFHYLLFLKAVVAARVCNVALKINAKSKISSEMRLKKKFLY